MTDTSVLEIGFHALLDASPDASMVVDANGRVVAFNSEAERLLGWSEAELVGEPMNLLVPARFHQVLDAQPELEQQLEARHVPGTRVTLFARRRDGTELPVEINRSPLVPGSDPLV